MATISDPKNDTAEILAELIKGKEISERQFRQNGFRSRLTELRRLGINLRCQWKKFKKRNKECQHKVHYIWMSQIPKAVRIYEKINGK
jgi:hypothetical protein